MALTYEKVIAAISKPPDMRNNFDLNNMLHWFRKKSDLFRTLKTELLFDIIKNLQFITKEKDELIIKQGDQGDCMYILLRGKVTIYILYAGKGENEDDKPNQPVLTAKGSEALRQQLGTFVCPLGPGATFGEVALMSEDCIRTASIIADETTDLIVVDRDLYNRSVKNVLKKEFEDKTQFIANNPYFQTWAPKYKKQLAMALQKDSFPYEGMLTKQGDPVGAIYFILTGEIKMVVDPAGHKVQYPKICAEDEAPAIPEGKDEEEDELIRSVGSAKAFSLLESGLPSKFRKRIVKRQPQEVCLLGVNESIGDTEVLLDLDTNLQTALCTQRTEVLVLEMKHFERLLVKRNPRTIESMKEGLEIKLRSRCSKHVDKNVPIFRCLLSKAEEYNQQRQQQNEARMNAGQEKHVKHSRTIAESFDSFVPPRGALIDIHGPGTVFYMIRQREAAKAKKQQRNRDKNVVGFHGISGGGGASNGSVSDARPEDSTSTYGTRPYDAHYAGGSTGSVVDYETSDPVLTQLENRMRAWLANENMQAQAQAQAQAQLQHLPTQPSIASTKGQPRIAKLQRAPTDTNHLKPGARVVLRPKEMMAQDMLPADDEEDDKMLHHGSAWAKSSLGHYRSFHNNY